MRKYFTKQTIGWTALIGLLVIQLFRIDKTAPPINEANDFLSLVDAPPDILTMIKAACYDCHSDQSRYPWYTNIQPVAWWVKGHIKNGREELNFSVWDSYNDKKRDHKLEECSEMVAEQEMPLSSYTWVHKEARLSNDQRQQLSAWFNGLRL